jgi:CheY-like chemotaxis protein
MQISSCAPEIMVVDDDPQVREALTDFLGDEGFRVRDAADGADALEQLERLRTLRDLPALLILDLAMPVMDGYELLEQIQEDRQLSPIPIVVLSATIDREGLPEHITPLRKPIDSQVLIASIRGILGGRYPS